MGKEVFPDDLSLEATQVKRLGGGKTSVVATVTASGNTSIHTPAAGKAIRLFWVSAINNPTAATSPVIKVLIGDTEFYRVYAVSHWEPFEGAADEQLIINLSAAATVQVTAHIEEFTP